MKDENGTFSKNEATEKLFPKEKAPKKHEPVRVIVSYPMSEEWDGKPTKTFTACKWLLLLVLFMIVAAASVFAYHIYTRSDEDIKQTPKKTTIIELTDEDIKNYFLKQVLNHYDGVKQELSYAEQLQYFKNETETLKSNNLTYFINELNIAIPLLLPQNIDTHTSIIENLYNYTQNTKLWLEYAVEYESNLMSYDFQKSNEFVSLHEINNWGQDETEDLKKIWEKYTKPLDITIIDNVLEIFGTVVVFSDIVNLISGDNIIEQVSIIASVLHMDSNLTRNIDLTIFATDWRFQFPVTINLSGEDAPPTNLSIKNGANGLSGKNGGYFIAAGNIDLNKLTIISNGGAAAAGHNGSIGKNGIPSLKPLKIKIESLTNFNDCQCCILINNGTLNSAGEIIQSFRVYHDLSCGEEGLRGGKPGNPGQGGEILFFLPKFFEIKKGQNGAKAAHGLDGKNGISPMTNCYKNYYKILPATGTEYFTKAKWIPQTESICSNYSTLPLKKNPLNQKEKFDKLTKNLNKLSSAFDHFSTKARENLENQNNELFFLLENIESSSAVTNFTSALLLFDEFNDLENKYTKVEIFRSFLKKVNLVLNSSQDLETKYALEYLQIAVWTKISYIRSGFGENFIIDIDKYLNQLLETAKRLDVDIIKVSTIADGVKMELVNKFEKIKSSLEPTNELKCEANNLENDGRIKCLISMLSNVVTNFAQISSRILQEKETDELYKKIKYHVNAYKKMIDEYFPKNKQTVCDETTKENCTKFNNSKSFVKMENAILEAFEKLEGNDFSFAFNNIANIILKLVHETRAFSANTRMYFHIRDFRDATEDFSALLHSCNRLLLDKLLQTKLDFLRLQNFEKKQLFNKVDFTKQKIIQNFLRDQYTRALNAYQQWAFPYTDTIEILPPGAEKSQLINGIKAIKDARTSYVSTIDDRDSQIIKADFTISSSEPFYIWKNKDYNFAIKELLSGREVHLRANLFDSHHIVTKQAIKFQTAELKLTGVPKQILRQYNVNVTHSGYSNYMYNNSAVTIVGREINFLHSFKHNRRTGNPTSYSLTLEKVKRGEIMLSPYTTWTVRLVPTTITRDFTEIQKYANLTDIHLEGSGSYVLMPPSTIKYNSPNVS